MASSIECTSAAEPRMSSANRGSPSDSASGSILSTALTAAAATLLAAAKTSLGSSDCKSPPSGTRSSVGGPLARDARDRIRADAPRLFLDDGEVDEDARVLRIDVVADGLHLADVE